MPEIISGWHAFCPFLLMASRLLVDFEDLYVNLGKVYASVQGIVFRIAQEHQLSISHLQVLLISSRLGAGREWIPLKEIYPYFQLTQPAIGRLVRYLAYWEYIELKRDEEDRRRLLIRILTGGKAVLQRFRQMSEEHLDMPSLELLQRTLQKLYRRTFAGACELPAK